MQDFFANAPRRDTNDRDTVPRDSTESGAPCL